MKTKLIISLFLLALLPTQIVAKGASKKFYPGEIWKDNNGVHINAHGGGVINYNGTYYWFGEHKSDSTSSAMVGVTCYSSKNLVDWTNRNFKVSTEHAVPWAGLRPMMPNMMPVVRRGKLERVFFNTGHGHLGWTLSAATAAMISQEVATAYPV